MRWRLFRRRRPQDKPQPPAQDQAAMFHAQRQLRDVERLSERVNEVADQLHEIKRRNHFGEAVEWSMRRAQHP